MNTVQHIQEVLSIKDEAIVEAIERIKLERDEVCTEGHCEIASNYHWRGCPTNVDPIINRLRQAFEAR